LAGDRVAAEDEAIIGGLAKLNGQTVMVIGQEKGHDTESRIKHNFGMARPEGYRKAIRLMQLAEQYRIPVVTLVDTAGAFPGVEAEARGQGQAIAACIETSLNLKVPVISCIIGEGGSGGALALASGNVVLMLENAIYSVIAPESCASILWKDNKFRATAAAAMKLTAADMMEMRVIDKIIPEPAGGAHTDWKVTMQNLADMVSEQIKLLQKTAPEKLPELRAEKFLKMTRKIDGESGKKGK
jgi:acetyl-CoA carboxylase carboxyl transferase subunit alpha